MTSLAKTLSLGLLSLGTMISPVVANTVHYKITGTIGSSMDANGKPANLDLLPKKNARLVLQFDVTAPVFGLGSGWDGRDFNADTSEVSYRVGRRKVPVTLNGVSFYNLYAKAFIYFEVSGPSSTELVMIGFAIDGIFNPYFRATPTGPVLNTGVFNPGPPLAPGQGTTPAEDIAAVDIAIISDPYTINTPYGVGLDNSLVRVTRDVDDSCDASDNDSGK